MIEVKKLKDLNDRELGGLFQRFGEDFSELMINSVVPIVNDVGNRGDEAVKQYTEKFDGVKLENLFAGPEEIAKTKKAVPGDVLESFRRAKENIEEFHGRQKRESYSYYREDGTMLGVQYEPIENVAVYVPGGKAAYPSSVLMGVIPAQIAGCKNITLITPPDAEGSVNDTVLAVCDMVNVSNILKVGGAQGIAAAGLGTQTVVKSDLIVGPGNIYVTAAKTYLFSLGIIQIDSMAGPSEVLIVADESADPKWAAFDMLSQAEHDEMAIAVLVTPVEELAKAVAEEIKKDIESGCGRSDIKKAALRNSNIIISDTMEEALDFSSKYGPEHMELLVNNPLEYLPKIRNVGSLFLGHYAPVAVGDYYSGTNHILPTGGAARFSSGVGVDTFMRKTTFQMLNRDALKNASGPVKLMAGVEGFDDKHGGSVEIRFKK